MSGSPHSSDDELGAVRSDTRALRGIHARVLSSRPRSLPTAVPSDMSVLDALPGPKGGAFGAKASQALVERLSVGGESISGPRDRRGVSWDARRAPPADDSQMVRLVYIPKPHYSHTILVL